MRFIYLLLLMFSGFLFSSTSSASTFSWWTIDASGTKYSSFASAISVQAPQLRSPFVYKLSGTSPQLETYQIYANPDQNNTYSPSGYAYKGTTSCPFGHTGLQCNSSCNAPNVMEGGQCVPPSDPCASKNGQPTTWKKTWPSADAYQTLGEKINNSGCSAVIVTSSCGTNGATGEFACWGIATYDGVTGVDATGPSSACGASDPNCAAPEPVTSTNSQKCTPNADGTTTCVTESGSTEFAAGQCHVGSTGGATGLVCVKPDYVPEAATNKRTDVIKTEATADGGTKTTTTSTSENKHCVAGVCTNTTTTTTTTTTKDGAGKVTSETSACTGAKCDKPTDETEPEDEGMGEAKFSGKGVCEGSDCDVDAFNPFGTDVVPGYSDSLNAALSGIKRSPIGSAVSNIRWPTGGSCPVYSMQLFNSSISITEHCTVWDSVGSALSAVFLAIWAFAAVRVFLSA